MEFTIILALIWAMLALWSALCEGIDGALRKLAEWGEAKWPRAFRNLW